MNASKIELRRSLLETRLSLSRDVWRTKSNIICHHLQDSTLFTQAKTVLAYFSFRQEPDLSPLFCLPKRWGFPRCLGDTLSWHDWTLGDELEANGYGILEPKIDAPRIEPAKVDLMLVPGVGCDRSGYRLGYGGGYYDRLFSLPEWQNIPRIGIVFDLAYLSTLPRDVWDFPLTGLCTEVGILRSTDNKLL
nr:5-formyltetrahydrofolate cyclo-ligase [Merismopedia glauca]